ncbi:MAG: Lrp/AsnC family transcriptional regulator [Thermoleophilaceae bacterium]|nr:Lrp/AsnC family transcriptional regulator [Thermoleophilaceae bacterium]
MDAIDREIVRLLRANGRINQESVAREVRLSRPAVHERIKRLEGSGVIRGYEALVDWVALGLPVTAFVWARTSGQTRCRDAGPALMELSGDGAVVEECHSVTGEWCLLLKVRAASPSALQDLIDAARDAPGVEATMTTVALSTVGENGRLLDGRPGRDRDGTPS